MEALKDQAKRLSYLIKKNDNYHIISRLCIIILFPMKGRTPYNDAKREFFLEYLKKYPDTSSRTLARMIYRDGPEFFKDEEAARQVVRRYRGKCGDYARKTIKLNQYYQK